MKTFCATHTKIAPPNMLENIIRAVPIGASVFGRTVCLGNDDKFYIPKPTPAPDMT
jgi:hypothetical protein